MLFKKLILPSLATILFFNSHLIADEAIQENSEASIEGHVAVRSREIDPAKLQQMQDSEKEQPKEETDAETEAQKAIHRTSNTLISSESQFMLAPRQMTQRPLTLASYKFPINCHWLISMGENYTSIEMEDGSHWQISPADAQALRNWHREDALVITPNYSFLSRWLGDWLGSWLNRNDYDYDYFITNKSTNTYVKANLFVGPLVYGPYSHWIVDIDQRSGHVYLENQMVWCVDPDCDGILRSWGVNDHVIFGVYNSWSCPFDHVLINVNMDDHVRAKQY